MLHRALVLPWLAGLLLQAILVAILLAKRMWAKFPIFVAYSVSNFFLGAVLYGIFVAGVRIAYFGVYWLNEALGLILGFALVYEIFKHLFSPYPALRKLATQTFQGAVMLLLVLGCVIVYTQKPMGESHPVTAAFLVVEEAARILEVGLLFFLFLFTSALGLHWRQYAFGIALGLGVFTAVELVRLTMRLHFGLPQSPIFNVVRTISFNSSLLIWISYILAPELATTPAEVPKRAQLEQWNRAVTELIYQ